ncbi:MULTISPECIES: universal stress protein [unclassified Streptomyces]|uniref:universal stress protein n=1 Tax=unclassified Streptomyces TaxID=2593676 RepID=UPI002B1DB816|nr:MULTISPECIES: universal stress protein [unclassified Streptomyces]
MRGITGSPELGSVTVGVDGSEPARRAALWAAAEAARRGSTLRIVHATDTDSRVLGGFNWSSQHPDLGGVRRGYGGLEFEDQRCPGGAASAVAR